MDKDIEIDKYDLTKHFDSKILTILMDPEQRTLKNKYLAVAFWDLSGFAKSINHEFLTTSK